MPDRTSRVLFFEDVPFASENRLFKMLIHERCGDSVRIQEERTVPGFEAAVRSKNHDVMILDIMAVSVEDLLWDRTSADAVQVPEGLTGVALLRFCRTGEYGEHYKNIPIFMRSARGENHVKKLCTQEGCTGYFRAGADDEKLIDALALIFRD